MSAPTAPIVVLQGDPVVPDMKPPDRYGPTGPTDPGTLGQLFQDAGYAYLGPGTDLKYNELNGVQPVDELDGIAKVHDYAYRDIQEAFLNGLMTYDKAAAAVAAADEEFIQNARTAGLYGLLSSMGMTMKAFKDSFMGPSYAGIDANAYGSKREEYNTSQFATKGIPLPGRWDPNEKDMNYWYWLVHNGLLDARNASGEWTYTPSGYANWYWDTYKSKDHVPVDTRDDYISPGYKPNDPRFVPDVPVSRISVVVDRDNNGVPDALERKRRRKRDISRYQPYGSVRRRVSRVGRRR